MIHLADMVVSVCAWLTNFEPVLVDNQAEDKVFKSVNLILNMMPVESQVTKMTLVAVTREYLLMQVVLSFTHSLSFLLPLPFCVVMRIVIIIIHVVIIKRSIQ